MYQYKAMLILLLMSIILYRSISKKEKDKNINIVSLPAPKCILPFINIFKDKLIKIG